MLRISKKEKHNLTLRLAQWSLCSNVLNLGEDPERGYGGGLGSCYVGETNRHLSTGIREYLTWNRSTHIFQHLQHSEECRCLCFDKCFLILDHATTKYQVKIKEALHIHW